MESLVATAPSLGSLVAEYRFRVPPFQREYSWGLEQVSDLLEDMSSALEDDSYFLGLFILTGSGHTKQVVDGQQRLISLILVGNALYHFAKAAGRPALANRLEGEFLYDIDYSSDEKSIRLELVDTRDNQALVDLITNGPLAEPGTRDVSKVGDRIYGASHLIAKFLEADLGLNQFARLGLWTEFLFKRLTLTVFAHPDPAGAYRIYEVVNTRGLDLTTADLLKNFLLSKVGDTERDDAYDRWKLIADAFREAAPNAFVQFIRHVVTLDSGHILSKDLYSYLAGRRRSGGSQPPEPPEPLALLQSLEEWLPFYLQFVDPDQDGPAGDEERLVLLALSDLGVTGLRPVIMALHSTGAGPGPMTSVLRLAVRRMVVGNLGTGNVERLFANAARDLTVGADFAPVLAALATLDPPDGEFEARAAGRSVSPQLLDFIRRSEVQGTVTPEHRSYLHLIRPRQAIGWDDFGSQDFADFGTTVGNTFLATVSRRPRGTSSWESFKAGLLPLADPGEHLAAGDTWSAEDAKTRGEEIARKLVQIWPAVREQ